MIVRSGLLHAAPQAALKRHPRCRQCRQPATSANLIRFSEEEVKVDSSLGTIGILNVTQSRPPSMPQVPGLSTGMPQAEQQQQQQQVSDSGVQARLYTGRLVRGQLMGTRVLLKAYPAADSEEVVTMAANEIAAHTTLQPPAAPAECDQLAKLMGSFSPRAGPDAGEQWLVFRNDGLTTAASYAAMAAEAGSRGSAVGRDELLDRFSPARPLARRRLFVLRLLRQVIAGLAFMHGRQRLHQSLGPGSVLLNSVDESAPQRLQARLADLALAVDASDEALFGGATLAAIWERNAIYANDPLKKMGDALWMRAREAGAWAELERRSYGIADDVYAAGLLIAYMAFVPFCEPGSIDGPTIQRVLEGTFRLDMEAAREFCAADGRWQAAVDFLDAGGSAGWDLVKAMLNPEWRLRPTAESVLKHPWLSGQALETLQQPPPRGDAG